MPAVGILPASRPRYGVGRLRGGGGESGGGLAGARAGGESAAWAGAGDRRRGVAGDKIRNGRAVTGATRRGMDLRGDCSLRLDGTGSRSGMDPAAFASARRDG